MANVLWACAAVHVPADLAAPLVAGPILVAPKLTH